MGENADLSSPYLFTNGDNDEILIVSGKTTSPTQKLMLFDNKGVQKISIDINFSGISDFYFTHAFQNGFKPFVYVWQTSDITANNVMTKYDTRSGSSVLQKLNGKSYYKFVPNWNQNEYFLALDHATESVDKYSEQLNIVATASGIGKVWSAYLYKESNLQMSDAWSLFGDDQAVLHYRDMKTSSSSDFKTITFNNRTQSAMTINNINGIYETEFIVV